MTAVGQSILDLHHEIIVDLFAGGGGMSTAIEQALGRSPDVAINHDDDALSMHRANHPQTRHFVSDVWEVSPIGVTRGRPIGLLHLSPDCTDFSQSKGGQPRRKRTRSLSWIAHRWAGQVGPRIITLENVKQIQRWGPLIAKRDKATGRVVRLGGTVAALGERVPVQEQFLVPDRKRVGKTWRRFVACLRGLGYVVEWRVLRAADYGAPTTRERLFLVARRDGEPIVWPEPTHFRHPTKGQPRRVGARAWRSAAECIDWSLSCRSIFGRKRSLAPATLRRIVHGIRRYVLDADEPFIVPPGAGCSGVYAAPWGTATPQGAAYLAQMNGGFNTTPGHDARQPLSTITHRGSQQQLVVAHLAHLRRHCDARDLDEPLRTLSAGGQHHGLVTATTIPGGFSPEDSPVPPDGALRVAAFLLRYHSSGGQWSDLHNPMTTVTTKHRLALITVMIRGVPHVIVDIGLRMLVPRELYAAQGFPPDYRIDRGHDGRVFTKTAQIRMVGNSVSPPPAIALLAANAGDLAIHPAKRRAGGNGHV
ncbi:MAG TPA: DNA cytosine methyltransferase [Rhizobiales bacterium]|nr:DNA cytosine methyltransferase [Hyphomicrobiales bacterium]